MVPSIPFSCSGKKGELRVKAFWERSRTLLDGWGARLQNKEIRIPVDLTVGVLFSLVGLAVLWIMPQQVAVSEKDVVDGRAFPTLLMGVMLVCCGLLILKELYKLLTGRPLVWKTINLLVEVKALVLLAILVASYLLSRTTGLFVVGAVFCALGFLLYFRTKKPSHYVITLALAVGIWAVFRFVLGVDF